MSEIREMKFAVFYVEAVVSGSPSNLYIYSNSVLDAEFSVLNLCPLRGQSSLSSRDLRQSPMSADYLYPRHYSLMAST